MTNKHTPAPWDARRLMHNRNQSEYIIMHKNLYEEGEANAQLISTAPDLLEALLDIIAWHDGSKTYCNWIKAREALAKAIAIG